MYISRRVDCGRIEAIVVYAIYAETGPEGAQTLRYTDSGLMLHHVHRRRYRRTSDVIATIVMGVRCWAV